MGYQNKWYQFGCHMQIKTPLTKKSDCCNLQGRSIIYEKTKFEIANRIRNFKYDFTVHEVFTNLRCIA